MSGHGMLKYFRPITHKKDAPEDKDPPEGKELSNLSWPYLSKVIPPSSSLSIEVLDRGYQLLVTCITLT